METKRTLAAVTMTFVLLATQTLSQTKENNQTLSSSGAAKEEWSFSASTYIYVVPHTHVYINPNFTADHGKLHFEARYNYESLETGSLWVGYKLSRGKKLVFEFTPMLGGVFGRLNGVAPGYLLSLSFKKFDISSQGEYVISTGDREENFFYTWSEFGYSPVGWFRGGVVIQRTRAYQTPFDIQRGLFGGFSYKKVDFVTYVFNLDKSEKAVVTAFVVNF